MVELWNPHILAQVERDVRTIISRLDVARGCESYYQVAVEKTLAQITQAQSLLSKITGIKASFIEQRRGKSLLPLAYKLLPQMKKLRRDDPALQKFGGVPDLRWNLPFDKGNNYLDQVASIWPRCGVCHRPMRFICQLSPGLIAQLLNAITCEPLSSTASKYMVSGLGSAEHISVQGSPNWWHVFMCSKTHEHHDHPGYDSSILSDSRDGAWEHIAERDKEKKLAATIEFMTSIGELPTTDEGDSFDDDFDEIGPQIPLKEITGFTLGFELDPPARLEMDLSSAVEAVVSGNPELFGGKSDYVLFGRPVSQQRDVMRPFSQRGAWLSAPVAMSPLLNFLDSETDRTYQIYADFASSPTRLGQILCKVDASNT